MNWTQYISSNPAIPYGKLAITNTRIGVDLIRGKLSAGHTIQNLLQAYPHLKKEQILACLASVRPTVRPWISRPSKMIP